MDITEAKKKYALHLADNSLILGHRMSEWTGHGPVLEQDIAMSNIALDLIGQARNWYQLAGSLHTPTLTEDQLAYLRKEREYLHLMLCEQPNGDFGQTVLRQFLFDSVHQPLLEALTESPDADLAAVAKKSIKEVLYHKKWSAEWVIRLGDGTAESHQRMNTAIKNLWMYADEYAHISDYEKVLLDASLITDPSTFKKSITQERQDILERATLSYPTDTYMQRGGKDGLHTEHLGYILADLQYMQRTYPDAQW